MLVQKDAGQLTVIIVNVLWRVFQRSELTDMSDFYTRRVSKSDQQAAL